MPEIDVYFPADGSVHIRWNIEDGIPDHATLEKLAETIRKHKKSSAQSGNSEQNTAKSLTDSNNFSTEG